MQEPKFPDRIENRGNGGKIAALMVLVFVLAATVSVLAGYWYFSFVFALLFIVAMYYLIFMKN
jgi:hypothetical protein